MRRPIIEIEDPSKRQLSRTCNACVDQPTAHHVVVGVQHDDKHAQSTSLALCHDCAFALWRRLGVAVNK